LNPYFFERGSGSLAFGGCTFQGSLSQLGGSICRNKSFRTTRDTAKSTTEFYCWRGEFGCLWRRTSSPPKYLSHPEARQTLARNPDDHMRLLTLITVHIPRLRRIRTRTPARGGLRESSHRAPSSAGSTPVLVACRGKKTRSCRL